MANIMNRLYAAMPSVGLRLIKINAAKTIHYIFFEIPMNTYV